MQGTQSLFIRMLQYANWRRTRLWWCRPSIFTNEGTRLLSHWLWGRNRIFKLVKDKNGTTSFLPLREKTGGKVAYIQNKETMCLIEKQTDYVYKTVEEGNNINTKTMMYETEQS